MTQVNVSWLVFFIVLIFCFHFANATVATGIKEINQLWTDFYIKDHFGKNPLLQTLNLSQPLYYVVFNINYNVFLYITSIIQFMFNVQWVYNETMLHADASLKNLVLSF